MLGKQRIDMEMSHANNIPPARSKIAPTKNCATSRSDNAVTRGSKVNRVFSGECGPRETWRDEAPNAAVPRETIKGRHTMRMFVSRDKNLESRVTRNWRCELTADLALIASRNALRNRARVLYTYVHTRLSLYSPYRFTFYSPYHENTIHCF